MINKSVKCREIISGPDGKNLNVLGTVNIDVKFKNVMYRVNVFIIKGLKIPILGRPGISKLGILNSKMFNCGKENNVNIISGSTNRSRVVICQEFPELFNKLSKFQTEMKILIKDGAKPFVQSSPRVVPLALLSKLEN